MAGSDTAGDVAVGGVVVSDAPTPQRARDITVAPPDPGEQIDRLDRPDRTVATGERWDGGGRARRSAPDVVGVPWRRILVIALVLIGLVAALLFWLLRVTGGDMRQQAVTAWRDGNAAWSRGEIDTVCDTYDGIGAGGMWQDRATCIEAERAGYDQAGPVQRESLAAMTVDPALAQVVDDRTVVIWYRDARVNGVRPPYFTDTDLAVMRRLDGQGWRQIGVRYGSDVVGAVPAFVLESVPATTATPTGS
jgi:hypothetical protein